jgi:hypothetical protein
MVIIKNTNNKCWQRCGKMGMLLGLQISTTIIESYREIPQEAKNRTAI